jgi:uncharacterized protein (TIGR00297 family)
VFSIPSWAVGVVLAGAVTVMALRFGALSPGGALTAFVLGFLAMGAGWSWGILLILYFVTSSLLSRFRAAEKLRRTEDRVEKSGARDSQQVLANGGAFGIMALCHWMAPGEIWQAFAAGALAASAADTWATEIGTLARAEARSIIDWHPVPTGTSGGVTALGFVGSVAGAGLVALVAWLVQWPITTVVSALAGGLIGSLVDSLIGAALQARRHCPKCNALTERVVHGCGTRTDVVGGIEWLDNDGVNAIATLFGAVCGAAIATFV